jgi:hypothetical protein
MNNIVEQADHFCVDQNIAVLFLICDAVVLLYQGIDNILEIFYEFVLGIPLNKCILTNYEYFSPYF